MSQLEMIDTTNYTLTIPNPDDSWAPPIYTGFAEKVHEVLKPGTYSGIIENWATDTQAPVKVYVKIDSTVLGRFVMVPA